MLVKFTVDDDIARDIMTYTGQTVASKAFLQAARRAVELEEIYKRKDSQITRLMLQVEAYRQRIDDAREAALLLAEKTGQDDLFIDLN